MGDHDARQQPMSGFLGGFRREDGDLFDDPDAFVPAHLPDPGPFLEGHSVLEGDEHLAFHEITRAVFEERSVYDMTFGYNLARLNRDTRHPSAGYRYAEEADDPAVLRAEFTPTTPFCPQAHTLTIGSFRAWNGLTDRHRYDIVRVRVAPMHNQHEAINDRLHSLEDEFRATGEVPGEDDAIESTDPTGRQEPDAPF